MPMDIIDYDRLDEWGPCVGALISALDEKGLTGVCVLW